MTNFTYYTLLPVTYPLRFRLMSMPKINSPRTAIFVGLFFLLVAMVVKFIGLHPLFFWVLLSIGIFFKILFLLIDSRHKGFKMTPALYLIFTGVIMILAALFVRRSYLFSIWGDILFYTAITFKTTGVALLLLKRRR